MKLNLSIVGGLVLLCAFFLADAGHAGPRRDSTVGGVVEDWGNTFRNRVVTQSTAAVVLISSAPSSAGVGISDWSVRVFENAGNTDMTLYGNSTSFTIYHSTAGIHLDDAVTSPSNRFTFYGQGPVYAIWASTGVLGGGVSVNEFYWKAP